MNLLQPEINVQQLARMVLELSSQLHAERLHRLALETALVRAGALSAESLHKAASDPLLRAASRQVAGESIASLLRVLREDQDPRAPLQPQNFPI